MFLFIGFMILPILFILYGIYQRIEQRRNDLTQVDLLDSPRNILDNSDAIEFPAQDQAIKPASTPTALGLISYVIDQRCSLRSARCSVPPLTIYVCIGALECNKAATTLVNLIHHVFTWLIRLSS
jgi:hypothetical protein